MFAYPIVYFLCVYLTILLFSEHISYYQLVHIDTHSPTILNTRH